MRDGGRDGIGREPQARGPAITPSRDPALGRGNAWRLVDAGAPPRRGAENMGIDRALVESVAAGGATALRFYYWDPACLSLGRNQPAAGIYDRAAAAARGIDIVRRPTGGRAVLHDRELTYGVAVPLGELGSPRQTYAAINSALVAGLRRLGVAAAVAPERAAQVLASAPVASDRLELLTRISSGDAHGVEPAGWHHALGASPCFDSAARGEVVAGGRKLVGSAQRRVGRVLLQHGSLLLEDDQATAVELLVEPPPFEQLARPATLRELLGFVPPRAELEAALASGFEEVLGTALARDALSPVERRAALRWTAHFASDDWTWRR